MQLTTKGGFVDRAWRGFPYPIAPVTLVTSTDDLALERLVFAQPAGASQLARLNRLLNGQAFRGLPAGRSLARLRRLLDALGGIFVVTDQTQIVEQDLSDPTYGQNLVRAALEVDPDDRQAVTAFVSTYGVLAGSGQNDPLMGLLRSQDRTGPVALALLLIFKDDNSLVATVETLREFQRHVEWLRHLQSARVREKEWAEFNESLYPFLADIRPTIRWDRDEGVEPCWYVQGPHDVLWITLWDWATGGGKLRRCQRCKVLFSADHPRQEFCARPCANRASAARWYRKVGRVKRRAMRRRLS